MSDTVKLNSEVIKYLEDTLLRYQSDMAAIQDDISAAAAHGDLRENREYEIAKQAELLKRSQITRLQAVLDNCETEDTTQGKKYAKVEAMTFVTLLNLTTGKKEDIYVVIDDLGDVGQVDTSGNQLTPDKISIKSNFGLTLMGKPVESVITYNSQNFRILSVDQIDYERFF